MPEEKSPVVVLISGSGSNLQAIIDAQSQEDYAAEIKAVISNVAGVRGIERAQKANIPTHIIPHQGYPDRESYDREVSRVIDQYSPEVIVLAGFMRILSDWFVNKYTGKLLNIHPSLLPRHKGLNTHQQAIEAGDEFHGATVHYVTPELDGGPLILQARVPVVAGETAEQVAARVLQKEHLIYPIAVDWAARKRIKMVDGNVVLDGRKLQYPVLLEDL